LRGVFPNKNQVIRLKSNIFALPNFRDGYAIGSPNSSIDVQKRIDQWHRGLIPPSSLFWTRVSKCQYEFLPAPFRLPIWLKKVIFGCM